jgi:glutaredoxin
VTSPTRPVRRVTFYTRPGCHLCEQAEELLADLRRDYEVHVTSIDITTDLAIFERFKYEIPVVDVEGGGTVAGRIDERLLRHALNAGA